MHLEEIYLNISESPQVHGGVWRDFVILSPDTD